MTAVLIALFVLVYVAIALEGPLKVNRSGAALVGAGLLWTVYAISVGNAELVNEQLGETLIGTAQIALFLMGAMTIVEAIDAHDGFAVVRSLLKARSLSALTIIVSFLAFFLSAVLDNLTTAIVMVSILARLLREREDRLILAGMVVIAANAGGAWSPIGDVTTTMLWIGGRVTTGAIVGRLIVPSLVNMLVPLAFVAWKLRGRPVIAPDEVDDGRGQTTAFERNAVFVAGLVALMGVPVFKTVTHLPPFLGILFALGLLWMIGDLIHCREGPDKRPPITIAQALERIDTGAIMFFVGILLAVATLEHSGVLAALARWLDAEIGRLDVIVFLFGLLSAVVDNVPMVAAAMGMYHLGTHPPDSFLWEFMAYCAGTGGSILIIGSAAGVAAMGAEKIDFVWYLRRFALLAFAGYAAGALVYVLQNEFLSASM